jgi:hypothetical protein
VRRPNIASAGADLAFALLALVAGWVGANFAVAALVFLSAALVWGWTRRGVLGRMAWPQRVTNGALALAMLAIVLGLAYWIGLMLGGHT